MQVHEVALSSALMQDVGGARSKAKDGAAVRGVLDSDVGAEKLTGSACYRVVVYFAGRICCACVLCVQSMNAFHTRCIVAKKSAASSRGFGALGCTELCSILRFAVVTYVVPHRYNNQLVSMHSSSLFNLKVPLRPF